MSISTQTKEHTKHEIKSTVPVLKATANNPLPAAKLLNFHLLQHLQRLVPGLRPATAADDSIPTDRIHLKTNTASGVCFFGLWV